MSGTALAPVNTILSVDFGGGLLPIAGLRELDIDFGENQTMADDDLGDDYENMCPLQRTTAGSLKAVTFFDPSTATQFALHSAWNVGGGQPGAPNLALDSQVDWPTDPVRSQPLKLILKKLPVKVGRTEGISQDVEFGIAERPILPTS